MAESHYERARRLSGSEELGGVDWSPYRKPVNKYDERNPYSNVNFQADKLASLVSKRPLPPHMSIEEQRSGHDRTSLFLVDHSPEAQKADLEAGLNTVSSSINATSNRNTLDLPTGHVWENLYDPRKSLRHVGEVNWNHKTGEVNWFGVHENYRQYVPHLLEAASRSGVAQGGIPPTHADNLSHFSEALSKKYAPEHMTRDPAIEGYTKASWQGFRQESVDAHDAVGRVHRKAGQVLGEDSPEYAEITRHAYKTQEHYRNFADSVRNGNYKAAHRYSARVHDSLIDLHEALYNAAGRVPSHRPADANTLTDAASTVASLGYGLVN